MVYSDLQHGGCNSREGLAGGVVNLRRIVPTTCDQDSSIEKPGHAEPVPVGLRPAFIGCEGIRTDHHHFGGG